MREIVTLHFGQAGVQMGNATWELLTLEHGINEAGLLKEEPRKMECLETFFTMSQKGYFVPRSLYIDLEPSVVDEVRNGPYRQLFHPDKLITGPEDAASNFARGFFTVGKLILNTISYELRRTMESCDNVHGIIILRGLGGGTGSGLTSAIFDNLADYPKTYKLEIPIYPSPMLSSSTVEPYNSLLAQHFCMEDIDIGLLFDNEAVYEVCGKSLKKHTANYTMINRLIAQICSNLTVSIRFENTICSDFSALQCNLVPYPRIHFPVCTYAPILSDEQADHSNTTVEDLTRFAFSNENKMMKIDFAYGRIMSSALNYRGNICPYHVYRSLIEIKSKKVIEFVDWCPTGFRVGINLSPPVIVPESFLSSTEKNLTVLTNTSAMGQAWQRLTHKFYLLYSKKSFVHWFVGEGMEECEFTEALYNIGTLVKDYEECVVETKMDRNDELKTSRKSSGKESILSSKVNSLKSTDKVTTEGTVKEFNDVDCIRFNIDTAETNKSNLNENEESTKNYVIEKTETQIISNKPVVEFKEEEMENIEYFENEILNNNNEINDKEKNNIPKHICNVNGGNCNH